VLIAAPTKARTRWLLIDVFPDLLVLGCCTPVVRMVCVRLFEIPIILIPELENVEPTTTTPELTTTTTTRTFPSTTEVEEVKTAATNLPVSSYSLI
jgi:hypothetical protein